MSNLAEIRNMKPTQMMLGGKLRTITFDMNAYAELESRFGSVEEAMNKLQNGGMKQIRLMLWIGLIHEEAVIDSETGEPTGYNITPYQVGSWITNAEMLHEASEKLAAAIGADDASAAEQKVSEPKNV